MPTATKPKPETSKKTQGDAPNKRIAEQAIASTVGGNLVGALHDATVAMKSAQADYAFRSLPSPAHAPIFECTVRLNGMKAVATGSSKQAAKQMAARNWIYSYR